MPKLRLIVHHGSALAIAPTSANCRAAPSIAANRWRRAYQVT